MKGYSLYLIAACSLMAAGCHEDLEGILWVGIYEVPVLDPNSTGMSYINENYKAIYITDDSVNMITFPSVRYGREYEIIQTPISSEGDTMNVYLTQYDENITFKKEQQFLAMKSSNIESPELVFYEAVPTSHGLSAHNIHNMLDGESYTITIRNEISVLEFVDSVNVFIKESATNISIINNYYVIDLFGEIFLVLDKMYLTKVQILNIDSGKINGFAFETFPDSAILQPIVYNSISTSDIVGSWKGVVQDDQHRSTSGLYEVGNRIEQEITFTQDTVTYTGRSESIIKSYDLYPKTGILSIEDDGLWSVHKLNDTTIRITTAIVNLKQIVYDQTDFMKVK